LSLVLKKRPSGGICDLVSAGLETVALRVPAHPVAQALLAAAKLPIAAPSANRSGRISPTTAAHVAAELDDRPAMILDGGPCPIGIESTVIAVLGGTPALLRPGAVPREAIELVLGAPLSAAKANHRGASPGQLESHYAPNTPLRLDVTRPETGETLLAFGAEVPEFEGRSINLSPGGNLEEAAARLFAALRELDQAGAAAIAVMSIPAHGLGEAINDRLQRAANRR
jgi:L-threonylcarbamoyladenylate synthase